MNPEGANLLGLLKDIHAAPDAPFWPPAPGWWLVAVLVLIALFFVLRALATYWRAWQRRNRLFGFVDFVRTAIDPGDQPQAYLSCLNRVLKIVAIRAFPEQQCAFMQGQDWSAFLSARLEKCDPQSLAMFALGPYQPSPDFDAEALDGIARQWIRQYG